MLHHRAAAVALAAVTLGWAGCAADDAIEIAARGLAEDGTRENVVVGAVYLYGIKRTCFPE